MAQNIFVELEKGQNFNCYPYNVGSVVLRQKTGSSLYPFRREIYWPVISPTALYIRARILGFFMRRETSPFVIMYGLLSNIEGQQESFIPVREPIVQWSLCPAGESSLAKIVIQAEKAAYQYALNQAERLEVPENWQLIINDKIAHSRRVIPYSETECAKERKRIELSGRLRTNSD